MRGDVTVLTYCVDRVQQDRALAINQSCGKWRSTLPAVFSSEFDHRFKVANVFLAQPGIHPDSMLPAVCCFNVYYWPM